MNKNRTASNSDTDLTQARSLDVRSGLLVQRRRFGAKTLAGHLCSNLLEMLENLAKTTDRDQRAKLERDIQIQMAELSSLAKGNRGGEA